MKIFTNEQIKDIRWALENINFNHWKNNWHYGYNYLSHHEIKNRAGRILYENNIHKFAKNEELYVSDIEKYLNKCEIINQILDVFYSSHISYSEIKECLGLIDLHFKEKVEAEEIKLKTIIKNLVNRDINELL